MARTRIHPKGEKRRIRRRSRRYVREDQPIRFSRSDRRNRGTRARHSVAERCIYCRRQKAPGDSSKEHVILRALGKFRGNLTVTCVCRECNQYFGRTIDLVLARDSIEAVSRLREIPSGRRHVHKWVPKNVSFEMPALAGTEAGKLRPVIYRDDPILVPQDYLALDQHDPSGKPETFPAFESCGPLQIEERTIRVTAHVRLEHLRAVAKTAFNYLAYCAHHVGLPQLPLDHRFDAIRAFIRHGAFQGRPPVHVGEGPVLTGDEEYWRRRGHVIALAQDDLTRFVAVVSFFGRTRYYVVLTTAPWRLFLDPLQCGHYFALGASVNEVRELRVRRGSLLLPTILRPCFRA